MSASQVRGHVLCFPSALLDQLGRFQGFSTDIDRFFPTIITPPNFRYVPRDAAEDDPSWKQIIPYVLLVHEENIFVYRRGKRGSESRLHELYSVGIGGHIEVDDPLLWSTDEVGYEEALWRELLEEVDIPRDSPITSVGLINDDSTSVGRVHFGVVHLARLATPAASKKDPAITQGRMMPLAEVQRSTMNFEDWSRHCLDKTDALLKMVGIG